MDDPSKKALLRETFDTVAENYENEALRFFPNSAQVLAGLLDLQGDERVLDVATGTGHAALAVAERLPQGRVIGVDFATGMLEQARQKADALKTRNVEFIEMDMHSLEFPEGSFDAATCAFGIFFAENMEAQLSSIVAMVKPGGAIAISGFQENLFRPLTDLFFKRLQSYGIPEPDQGWKRIATRESCISFFENAGIADVQVVPKNMGYFLDDAEAWWDVIWNAGLRRLVGGMEPDLREKFRQEHLQEVEDLSTADGIWLDVGVLFTFGMKQ